VVTGPEHDREADPLAHVVVGDSDPTHASWEDCNAEWCTPRPQWNLLCSREPHPEHWQHIAGNGLRVVAVWTGAASEGTQ